jgi:PNKP adenylyltransferase domain, C-terminal region/RNA repair, ligase-Pnkp-associating, region of Hen1
MASRRVLLTITTTHRPAMELGFLLHKHPDRFRPSRCPSAPRTSSICGRRNALHSGAAARHRARRPRASSSRASSAVAASTLRIIYGFEFADPDQIDRLRRRSLGRKPLAVREFALAVEALERVRREPQHRVHECVFGVLAMESEPVDPRL